MSPFLFNAPARLALAALAALVALAVSPRAARGQGACAIGEWTEPRILWRVSKDSAAMHPTALASSPDRLVVVSEYPSSVPAHKAATALGIVVDRRSGAVTELRKPTPKLSYRGLRAGIDRAGVIHLLWGETAGITTSDSSGGVDATQIWAARVERGVVTTPTFVMADSSLAWDHHFAAPVLLDSRGQLHTVVSQVPSSTRTPFALLSYQNGKWRVSHPLLRPPVVPLAASLDVVGDTLHAVYSAKDPSDDGAMTGAVWYLRRGIDQVRWSNPVRLSGRTPLLTQAPRISVTSRGTIRAAWLQAERQGAMEYDSIGVTESTDGGVTFGAPRVIDSVKRAHALPSMWSDACSTTHLHVIHGALGRGDFSRTLSWSGADIRVSDPQPHPFVFVGRSVIGTPPGGPLTRIWSSLEMPPDRPMTLYWYESHQRAVVPSR